MAFFTSRPAKFHWRFENDEAFVLIEGRIAITMDTGERFEMVAGMPYRFRLGTRGLRGLRVQPKFTVVTSGIAD